jgi:hypothetical protein
MEKAFSVVIVMLAVVLIAFGATATVGSIRSNGVIDYCYVEMWSPPQMAPQYQLWGHRPWRNDRNIGVYLTIEEAKSKADAMGCKLNGN